MNTGSQNLRNAGAIHQYVSASCSPIGVGACVESPLAPIQAKQFELSDEIGKLGGMLEELERRTQPVRVQVNECEKAINPAPPEPTFAPIEYTIADDIRRVRVWQAQVGRLLSELRI